jgi:dTMP kinase
MQREDTDFTVKNFIVFEGIDGSGTTTQLHRLGEAMEKAGISPMITAEPTTRPEGALIRKILRGEIAAEPGTVAYLFAADRYQHLHGEEGILRAVGNGAVVLCDRYALSSLAYQGMTCGIELPRLLNSGFPRPGLTLFFRVDPEIAMRRVNSRNQLEIYEKLHIQKLVGQAYEVRIAEAEASGWNIVTIDAEKSIDEVSSQVFEAIGSHLGVSLR